jgi:ApbE superfamily uncharacterized protein (UPF0280 family)
MEDFAVDCVKRIRRTIEMYAERDRDFLTSLLPYEMYDDAPRIVKKMSDYGKRAHVGPMASVAGTVAQEIGMLLEDEFEIGEIIVENGGDIYMNITQPTLVSVYAGASPLSEKIGLKVLPQFAPLGICASSGTVGHSLSFGKADAVVVACREAGLADAYATAFCNTTIGKKDISALLDAVQCEKEVFSVLVVYGDKVGVRGVFPFEVMDAKSLVDNP